MKCSECGKHLTNDEDCFGHDCEVFTVQDEIWKSRKWNKDKTDYIDLSEEDKVQQSLTGKTVEEERRTLNGGA